MTPCVSCAPQTPAMPATAAIHRSRVSLALLGCVLALSWVSNAHAQPPRTARHKAKPFAAYSESAHSMRDSLVAVAQAQVGRRYVRGGTSPEHGFDCSGLVRYVLASLKVDMPRTARQQAKTGFAVVRDRSRLRPGDLLTFGNGVKGVSHVGIYIGNGRIVHASSGAGRVIESDLERSSSSLIRAWRGVRRVLAVAASDSTLGGNG